MTAITWQVPSAVAIVCAITLVFAPVTLIYLSMTDHDAARVVQLALLAAVAIAVVATTVFQPSAQSELPSRSLVLIVSVGLLTAASVWQSDLRRYAALEAGLLFALGLLALSFADATFDRYVKWLLVVPVVASSVFGFIVAVRYSAALVTESTLLREHLFPGFSNYRFLNHVQTVTIPLLLAAMLMGPTRYALRRWALFALVLEFCWLFFSGGRATLLALSGATVLVWLFFGTRARAWTIWLLVAASLGAALYATMFQLVPAALDLGRDFFAGDFATRSQADVGTPRKYLWGLALDYIRESTLVGIGPMHYAARVNTEAAHPHNFYLQLAAEWGVPFALLLVGLAIAGLKRLISATKSAGDEEEQALGISLVGACCAIAIDAMFSGNFVMPMSQLWIAFAAGLSIAYTRRWLPSKGRSVHIRPAVARTVLVLLCLGSQLAIWYGVWPEILDVPAHVDRVRGEVVTNERDNPRVWSHGWIR